MPRNNVAKVCISGGRYEFDRPYDYYLPAELGEVAPGMRVLVPFGNGNRKTEGMVLSLAYREDLEKVKPVSVLLDRSPILSGELLRLVLWMRENCFCTCYEAIRSVLPAYLGLTLTCKYTLTDDSLAESTEEKAVCAYLSGRLSAEGKDILSNVDIPEGERLLRQMCKKGILTGEDSSRARVSEKLARAIRIEDVEAARELCRQTGARTEKQRIALIALFSGELLVSDLCYQTGLKPTVCDTLVKKGICTFFQKRILRTPRELREGEVMPFPALSGEQATVCEGIWKLCGDGKAHCALLNGVTGSGKTVVYVHLIERMLKENRGCILLVPEIALTPQLIRRFTAHFGNRVAVLHSGLSDGERYDQWLAIRDGKADVVIGTRSAVFAPVKNPGLIILDEEQEYSYKSGETPRYHAREVAKFRANANACTLLLGSATPSVESTYFARTGRYESFFLRNRFAGAKLPQVKIIDHKLDLRRGTDAPIGRELMEEIGKTAQEGHQSILFLNRRGRNKRVFCTECGESISCPHCSVTAAYHSANGRIMCHTCGWSQKVPVLCPSCGSRHLAFDRAGTQLAEEQINQELPGVRVLRMDADTAAGSGAHDELLSRFRAENIPVMVGTQMVAKGLDFPNVTLAAVLDGDMGLQSDDFRSAERCFSLITQSVGRAGRGENPGMAIIQTLIPQNPVILYGAAQDYNGFYEAEIENRQTLRLPPFYDLAVIFAASESQRDAVEALTFAKKVLKEHLSASPEIRMELLGPAPGAVARINNKFRYRLTIRMHNSHSARVLIEQALRETCGRREFGRVNLSADINPYE